MARPPFVITAKIDGLDKLQRRVSGGDARATFEMQRAMTRSVLRVERRTKQNIRRVGAIAFGDFIRSVQSAVVKSGNKIVGLIGSTVLHSRYIELGRGPGPVPLAPIIAWVRRKGLAAGTNTSAESIAFLIARKLRRVGFKARPVFGPAYVTERAAIAAEFQQALRNLSQWLRS